LKIVFIVIVVTSFQMRCFGRKEKFFKILKKIKNRNKNNTTAVSTNTVLDSATTSGQLTNLNNKANNEDKFHDSANFIIGNGHILAIIGLAVLSMLPTRIIRQMGGSNIETILTGNGRSWYHGAKLANLTFHYLIFPLLVILFNPAMRRSIWREVFKSKAVFPIQH
jgi:hypothetical protein